jgi:hypothetical protein
MASTSHAAWDTDRPSISPNAADLQAVPSLLTQYMACAPCTAPTSHAAWAARSYVPKLLAHRALEPAAVVIARRGNNTSARPSSVRRRAITDARSC